MEHALTVNETNSIPSIQVIKEAAHDAFDETTMLHGWAGIFLATLIVATIFAVALLLIRWLFRNNSAIIRRNGNPYHRPYEQPGGLYNPSKV